MYSVNDGHKTKGYLCYFNVFMLVYIPSIIIGYAINSQNVIVSRNVSPSVIFASGICTH